MKTALVPFVLAVIVVVVLTAIGIGHIKLFDSKFDDEELHRKFKSLKRISDRNKYVVQLQNRQMENVIMAKFHWLPENNTLSNFFLNKKLKERGGKKTLREYRDSVIVYIYSPWSSDTRIVNCVQELSSNNSLALSPYMSSKQRQIWDSGSLEHSVNRFREKYKFHSGDRSFGICSNVKQNCSQFMFFKDPLQSAISTYQHCRENKFEEHCRGMDAEKMSLRAWIIETGSVMFNQLLFKNEFCTYFPSLSSNVISNNASRDTTSCWLKQRPHLQNFSRIELTHATNYIMANLPKWFSVIGLWDEFDTSLKMLQQAFHFHFTKCKMPGHGHGPDKNHKGNSANSVSYSFHDKASDTNDDYWDENGLDNLRNDIYVKEALRADYRIFKEAKRLFNLQKQVILNSLS